MWGSNPTTCQSLVGLGWDFHPEPRGAVLVAFSIERKNTPEPRAKGRNAVRFQNVQREKRNDAPRLYIEFQTRYDQSNQSLSSPSLAPHECICGFYILKRTRKSNLTREPFFEKRADQTRIYLDYRMRAGALFVELVITQRS